MSVDPSEDLVVLDSHRVSGSCDWFGSTAEYTDWSRHGCKANSFLRLTGSAGNGKSTICSYAIKKLLDEGKNCHFFFFKTGSTGKATSLDCLKSLALQMASCNRRARSTLLDSGQHNLQRSCEEDRTAWRKLFEECLFDGQSSEPCYWVIDALDECSNPQSLLRLFYRSPRNLQVLISSRATREVEQAFLSFDRPVTLQQVCAANTSGDIRSMVESALHRLPTVSFEDAPELIDRLVSKSCGSFLWTRLVLQELENVYSVEAIEEAISILPTGMTEVYDRMLKRIAGSGRGAALLKSILTWTTCAMRSLSLDEIQTAIRLHVGETICTPKKTIQCICDQFIVVDQFSKIQLIHETAREYLLHQEQVPELTISKREAHTSLAIACLRFLTGDWFKRPQQDERRPSYGQRLKAKGNAKISITDAVSPDKAFAAYACSHFAEHISKSRFNSELVDLLCLFLDETILSWIECIAMTGDLFILRRTSMSMKRFLERNARNLPPIDYRVHTIEAWSIDLIRVGAKFRAQLLISPSSIHSMIPAFCPSDSIISKCHRSGPRSFDIVGLRLPDWDDCIARLDFHEERSSAVACGESSFAIGLSNGRVRVRLNASFQEQGILDHGERVKIMRYSDGDRYLVTAGQRVVRMWSLQSFALLWSNKTVRAPLAVSFMEDDEFINVALQNNTMQTFQVTDGSEVGMLELMETKYDDFGLAEKPSGRDNKLGRNGRYLIEPKSYPPPSLMSFSSDSQLLAIGGRGQPVRLFDINDERFILECCRCESSLSGPIIHNSVDALAFNPNPEISVLVVSSGDGELQVFDINSGHLVCAVAGAFAHNMECAPDGKCLVTASAQGTIQVYDFGGVSGDQLSLSYQIHANDPGIRGLAFAADSLRFYDIRASQCRVWEPDFLVRRDGSEASSRSDMTELLPQRVKHKGVLGQSGEPDISAIYCHPERHIVFCGLRDGSIHVYSTANASRVGTIRGSSGKTTVVALTAAFASKVVLVSADAAGCLSIMQVLEKADCDSWRLEESVERRTGGSIAKTIINATGSHFLAVGNEKLSLWSVSGEKLADRVFPSTDSIAVHPSRPDILITLAEDRARILKWEDLNELTPPGGILTSLSPTSSPNFPSSSAAGRDFLVDVRQGSGNQTLKSVQCWPAAAFDSQAKAILPQPAFGSLGPRVEQVLDTLGNTLLFLDVDLWICTIDLTTFGATQQIERHFFVPSEWRNSMGRILVVFSSTRREFIFACGSDLVVTKNGLKLQARFTPPGWNRAVALGKAR